MIARACTRLIFQASAIRPLCERLEGKHKRVDGAIDDPPEQEENRTSEQFDLHAETIATLAASVSEREAVSLVIIAGGPRSGVGQRDDCVISTDRPRVQSEASHARNARSVPTAEAGMRTPDGRAVGESGAVTRRNRAARKFSRGRNETFGDCEFGRELLTRNLLIKASRNTFYSAQDTPERSHKTLPLSSLTA